MAVRLSALSLCALTCLPALASAGPIAFTLGAGNLTTSPDAPQLGMALVPVVTSTATRSAELDSTQPVTLGVVAYEPGRIPTPDPRDVHPDGTTHWNNDGYFAVDVNLVDYASGESAILTLHGRAHMYSNYTTGSGWSGQTVFWFDEREQVTLGGNTYTVWGANRFTDGSGQAAVNVWVGSGAPVATPEPGTLVLAALGLAPIGLRRFRRTK
ncbi:PEP-CTERM sorting domain-containing protein [Gemmata sp. JC673]|uniref:PEP-CTERM sorting domain-containing protein n=1 Tax=Gemmata algarum TaxID=2975278 RepID=A0ABU5F976_9BACT|nr:PEP-CTERM sorting domain-containing protein [Gemmata algarum]MDY3562394.1 PEP-CTERM sorting domain-containing protein [Gemmata algarum]